MIAFLIKQHAGSTSDASVAIRPRSIVQLGTFCGCLQDTWSHVEFKFTQHKGTDVYLVKMAEEDFEALEDNQVLVQVRRHC